MVINSGVNKCKIPVPNVGLGYWPICWNSCKLHGGGVDTVIILQPAQSCGLDSEELPKASQNHGPNRKDISSLGML